MSGLLLASVTRKPRTSFTLHNSLYDHLRCQPSRQKQHGVRLKSGKPSSRKAEVVKPTAPQDSLFSRITSMATRVDYDALRAQAVETGNDEAVTVNTRGLIDKMLARYPREWSTLRELIQNAADAGASRVVIKIETSPSVRVPSPQTEDPSPRLKHVLQHHTIKRWVVENNGQRFRPEDWARLKEIANGNPDETKIGAFGVGFYSVFSISENPFVSSGSEAIEFYWKGDALFTRRFQHGVFQSTDTTFILPMRDSHIPVPHGAELFTLCQFLTRSMAFVGLESIELCIDDWRVLRLQKFMPGPVNIDIPTDINRTSSDRLMRLSKVTKDAIQLEAEWIAALQWSTNLRTDRGIAAVSESTTGKLTSLFNKWPKMLNQNIEKPEQDGKSASTDTVKNLTAVYQQKAFFHVNKAIIETSVGRDLSTEIQRARKKAPPRATTVSYLSQSYDERTASNIEKPTMASKLFESVTPTATGYIYIGFQTLQTTGLGAHLSIPALIPTVEREHIDLSSTHINTWNIGLLRAAGILARISWSSAMADFRRQESKYASISHGKAFAAKELAEIIPAASLAYETFNWKPAGPRSDVGQYIEKAFWSSSPEFEILSSRGIIPYKNVRIAPIDLSFIDELPVVPEPLLKAGLIKSLRDGGDLTEVQIEDIVWILENSKRTRTPAELQQLLVYLAGRARAKTITRADIRSVLNVAVVTDDEDESSRVIQLRQIKNHIDPNKIPPDMPLPPSTIPFKYTKTLSKFDTDALGLQELQSLDWIRWLVEDQNTSGQTAAKPNIEANPAFASSVLRILSKNWSSLSAESKAILTSLLDDRTIVPTRFGMKRPSEAYFSSVKVFDDLPIIQDLANVKEPVLAALGVRKTLEIGVVLERLMGSSSEPRGMGSRWSHVDLIKYLVSVWPDVPERDRQRLKGTPICPSEKSSGKPTDEKFQVANLYEPSDSLRRLGLPTLQWPGTYHPESKEGKLLCTLGLRDAPPYSELVQIIAAAGQSRDTSLRDYGIRYLIEHHQSKRYNESRTAEVKTPFLPVHGSEDKLSTPSECFTNERVGLLGFALLSKHLHQYAAQLGVQSDPPMERCIRRLLRKPPQSKRHAREIFAYMTSRLGLITNDHVNTLASARIVPVGMDKKPTDDDGSRLRYTTPRMCFLGDGGDFKNIFDFVDFGPEANTFLLRCGSKHEPSAAEIAHLLTQRPAKFLDELDVPKYMDILVQVAKAWDTLKSDASLVEAMRKAPFLLAAKEAASEGMKEQEDEEEGAAKTWQLAKASEIIIIGDDIINYQLFKSYVLAAPQQDETLEDFYIHLGAPTLGSLIEERQKFGEFTSDQTVALKLQSMIHERARLYLHQTPKESIRHDAKWVEKSLSIQAVRSIVVRTLLKGQNMTHTQHRTATLHREGSNKWVIYVTANYEIWDVSQVLSHLLLRRSKPGDAMMLESILRSDLRSLQRKGLNIDKILRQKEREAKIAQEMHQQQLEQEARVRRERESAQDEIERQGGLRGPDVREKDSMPGDFPGPSPGKIHDVGDEEPQNFLTDTLKKWGFDFGRKPQSALTNREAHTNGNRHAPSGDQDMGSLDPERGTHGSVPQRPPSEIPPTPQPPLQAMSPQQLQSQLQQAIRSCRPHTSSSLRSQPEAHKVEEMHTTCDVKPGMNILYAGTTSDIRVFLDEDFLASTQASGDQFIAANRDGLQHFASVLHDCATIYNVSRESVHVFYDIDSDTIAFNRANSLFFNYRVFQDEHLGMMQKGNKIKPICRWSSTMAHELSHNLEADHNVRFNYIMQNAANNGAVEAAASTNTNVKATTDITTASIESGASQGDVCGGV
ncbi:MAG: hypothetical protein Q9210_005996 [Variospora velana]